MTAKNRRTILSILFLFHVVAAIVAGRLVRIHPANAIMIGCVGTFFCQPSLLGLWAGAASVSWAVRLLVSVAGTVGLAAHVCYSFNDWSWVVISVVSVPLPCILVTMVLVRQYWYRLDLVSPETLADEPGSRQFSLRHLMLLTFMIAALLAFNHWHRRLAVYVNNDMWLSPVIIVSSLSISLASIWAMLSRCRVLVRSVLVVVVSQFLGLAISMSIRHGVDFRMDWCTVTAYQALATLASLYVVRRCGYRLTPVAEEHAGQGTNGISPCDVVPSSRMELHD